MCPLRLDKISAQSKTTGHSTKCKFRVFILFDFFLQSRTVQKQIPCVHFIWIFCRAGRHNMPIATPVERPYLRRFNTRCHSRGICSPGAETGMERIQTQRCCWRHKHERDPSGIWEMGQIRMKFWLPNDTVCYYKLNKTNCICCI